MSATIVTMLKQERNRIDQAIAALEGGRTPLTPTGRPRRHMSPEARARISARMKAAWKERKRAQKKAA